MDPIRGSSPGFSLPGPADLDAGCALLGSPATFAGIGEADGPIGCLLHVDLEEAGLVVALLAAVAAGLDGERLVDRAHVSLAGPFAAAVVVDGMHVPVAAGQRALVEGLAGLPRQRPPAFRRHPAGPVAIADGHPDTARGG